MQPVSIPKIRKSGLICHVDGGELRVGGDEPCGRDSRRTSEGNMGQQEMNLKYENLLLDKKALRCILFADSMGADRR